jgi:hypothetical protein
MEHASPPRPFQESGTMLNLTSRVEWCRSGCNDRGRAWNGREVCFIFIFRLEVLDFDELVREVWRA